MSDQKTVTAQIGGREWRFRMTLGALSVLKSKFGIDLPDVAAFEQQPQGFAAIEFGMKVAFALTRNMGAEAPSWEEIEALDVADAQALMTAIQAAFTAAMDQGAAGKEPAAPAEGQSSAA